MGRGRTYTGRPPAAGHGSAAAILCHSQRRVQQQQDDTRWRRWRSEESPPRVSPVHTVAAVPVEARWGRPGSSGSAGAPLFLAAGWGWVEKGLQLGGGHASMGMRVSVRVSVKRQTMQKV